MSGHGTCSALKRLARPDQVASRSSSRMCSSCGLERSRPNPKQSIRGFPLRTAKIRLAIESEQRGHELIAGRGKQTRLPAERRRGVAERRDRMPAIVLAVAPRPHSVFPCLAPVDRAQAQHDAAVLESGRPARMVERGPSFQRVIAAHVVIDARRQSGKIRAQQIAFRGMQIAAGRIATQRPTIAAERFPGRQTKRELEQDRNAANVEGERGRQVAAPEGGVARGQRIGGQRQLDRRRARERRNGSG